MAAVSASASLTVTASLYRTVEGSSSLLVTTPSVVRPYSIPLVYLGTGPDDQTNNIATKKYADDYFTTTSLVDQIWVDQACDQLRSNLLIQSDVQNVLSATDGSSNRIYPKVSELNTERDKYLTTADLGVSNGIARATATGALDQNQIPLDIRTDNKAVFINCLTAATSSVYFGGTSTHVSPSNLITNYTAATVTIPDPGFSYYPMNFVYIQGKSPTDPATLLSRSTGTPNSGLITVAPPPPSGQQLPSVIFAQGTCSPTPYRNWHVALPYVNRWNQGAPTRVAAGTSALRGDLTLSLYLANYGGNNYTFYAEGMTWYVILFPTNTPTVSV